MLDTALCIAKQHLAFDEILIAEVTEIESVSLTICSVVSSITRSIDKVSNINQCSPRVYCSPYARIGLGKRNGESDQACVVLLFKLFMAKSS